MISWCTALCGRVAVISGGLLQGCSALERPGGTLPLRRERLPQSGRRYLPPLKPSRVAEASFLFPERGRDLAMRPRVDLFRGFVRSEGPYLPSFSPCLKAERRPVRRETHSLV